MTETRLELSREQPFSQMDNLNKFQILSMNCNSAIGKLDLIKSYTKAYYPDIISMTETKLNQNFDDNELLGEDYTI